MKLSLFIRDITCGKFKTHCIEVEDHLTLNEFKQTIENTFGLPQSLQMLTYNTRVLEELDPSEAPYFLSDFGITNESTVTMDFKIRNETHRNPGFTFSKPIVMTSRAFKSFITANNSKYSYEKLEDRYVFTDINNRTTAFSVVVSN
jgi:hypothetical protein